MPEYTIKEKFAWRPIFATSGKWVWGRRYIKLEKIYHGPAGESPVVDVKYYTKSDWTMVCLKYKFGENINETH